MVTVSTLALPVKGMAESAFEADSAEIAFRCSPKTLPKAEAERLLKQVQAAYGAVEMFKANFRQYSFVATADIWEESKGEVWFSKPGKMKWHYLEPYEHTFVIRDTVMWHYEPDQKQVEVNQFRDVLVSDLPLTFLMGVGDLSKSFELKSACLNDFGTVIELTPRVSGDEKADSGGQELKGFLLLVDAKQRFPVGARVVHLGGSMNSVLLDNREESEAFPKEVFDFSVPPGTDIIDHRAR